MRRPSRNLGSLILGCQKSRNLNSDYPFIVIYQNSIKHLKFVVNHCVPTSLDPYYNIHTLSNGVVGKKWLKFDRVRRLLVPKHDLDHGLEHNFWALPTCDLLLYSLGTGISDRTNPIRPKYRKIQREISMPETLDVHEPLVTLFSLSCRSQQICQHLASEVLSQSSSLMSFPFVRVWPLNCSVFSYTFTLPHVSHVITSYGGACKEAIMELCLPYEDCCYTHTV